uniref:Fibronectin type-III domain-containing protein n=1 Tax=Auxenochlorella protothecoides TaxID=3075 RepID=A0A1D2A9B6_AUXPR
MADSRAPGLAHPGEDHEAPPPPPPRVEVPGPLLSPTVLGEDSSSLSISLHRASVLQTSHDGRPRHFGLNYDLQMQQLHEDQGVRDHKWRTQYLGPETHVRVNGLRPGRTYAIRVRVQLVCDDPEVELATPPPSPICTTSTTPTPPQAPAAPGLSSRQRNALKFKWCDPDETGGRPILEWVLQVAGPGVSEDPQGLHTVYRGADTSFLLKRLACGTRYTARVKAISCIGESPWSPTCSVSTPAAVPAAPLAPVVVERDASSVTLTWHAPHNNGSDLTGYLLELDDGGGDGFRFLYTGLALSHRAASLVSGAVHRFRLRAENGVGHSVWSPVLEVGTAATTPGEPEGLARLGATLTSVSLVWKAPASDGGCPVSGYSVELRPACKAAARTRPDSFAPVTECSGPSCTLTSLSPGCRYLVRVAARNEVGRGPTCVALAVATEAHVPEPPGPVSLVERSAEGGLSLAWAAPPHDGGSGITGYRLELVFAGWQEAAEGRQPAQGSEVLACDSGSAVVQALEPGALFTARVCALNAHGSSPHSAPVTLETAPGRPAAPDRPRLLRASGSDLTIGWSAPYGRGGGVRSFQLRIAPAAACLRPESLPGEPPRCSAQAYSGPATSCTVPDLQPATPYRAWVAGENAAGKGEWSAPLECRTQPVGPSPPQALAVESVGCRGAALSWAPPALDNGSPVLGYALQAGPAARRAGWRQVHVSDAAGGSCVARVTGLDPGQEWVFRARAWNEAGEGPWSEVVTLALPPDVPDAPAGPTFSGRTGTSVRVQWEAPAHDGGSAITAYVLEAWRRDGLAGAWTAVYSGPATAAKVADLPPDTEVAFRLRACSAAGASAAGSVAAVVTGPPPPPPPRRVAAVDDGGGVLRVSWEDGQEAAEPSTATNSAGPPPCTGHEVEVRPGKGRPVRLPGAAAAASARVPGLPIGVPLTVRVRRVGGREAGHGAWSVPVRCVVESAGAAEPAPAEAAPAPAGVGEPEAVVPRRRRAGPGAASGMALRVGATGPVAKARPRKATMLSGVARAAGLREADLATAGWALAIAALLLSALGLWSRSD